jgi:hypothetical protein
MPRTGANRLFAFAVAPDVADMFDMTAQVRTPAAVYSADVKARCFCYTGNLPSVSLSVAIARGHFFEPPSLIVW